MRKPAGVYEKKKTLGGAKRPRSRASEEFLSPSLLASQQPYTPSPTWQLLAPLLTPKAQWPRGKDSRTERV